MNPTPIKTKFRAVRAALLTALLAASVSAADAQTNVTVRHNDLARTGQYLNETVLNTSNVNPAQFGLVFTLPVDGEIYAQPLYVSNLTIPNKGTHNVVFVTTVHNTIYAYDADDQTGNLLWSVSLGPSVPSSVINTPNLPIEVGAVSTPTIDLTTGTLYVCCKDYFNSVQNFHLHALDIHTGAEKANSPVAISATVNGTGDGNDGAGHVPLNIPKQNQRVALTLANGNVYLGFGSHEDYNPYHGWVLSYNATTLAQTGVYCNTPNGGLGGLWMSGEGFPVDASGNLYYLGGNGTYDGVTNFGESLVKLSPALKQTDWFTPQNYDYLNSIDFDLASSSAMVMPGTGYILGGGKEGKIYVVNPANMGKFQAGSDSQVIQEFQASGGHIHSSMLYWNTPNNGPVLYVWGESDRLKAFKFTGGFFQTTAIQQSTMTVYPGYANGPGMAISANGSAAGSGVLWSSLPYDGDSVHQHVGGILRAFDATNLSKELWNSKMTVSDDSGVWAKWTPPVIVNGKVYQASFSGKLLVYGLLPAISPPAPTGLTAIAGNGYAVLNWASTPRAASYSVKRSATSGGPYTTIATGGTTTSYTDNGLTNGATYYYVVTAVNASGESAVSNQASAMPTTASSGPGTGLTGQYYNDPSTMAYPPNPGFTTLALTRNDATVNFDWGSGSPDPAVTVDNFTVRWTGQALAPVTGNYTFSVTGDDGVRLWIGGNQVINAWVDQSATTVSSAAITLTAGQEYDVKMEYYEHGGSAVAKLLWAYGSVAQSAIPQTYLYPALLTPPAPTNLTATAGNAQAVLNWTASPNAATYTLKSATVSGGPYTVVASSLTGTTYTNTGLTNGTKTYFVVCAVNAIGASSYSNEASATPILPDFGLTAAPVSLSVSQGASGTTTLTAPAIGGLSGYVTLSASGLPAGVTAAFVPVQVFTDRQSVVTFTAASNATVGTASVTLTGVSGNLTHTLTFPLTVTQTAVAAKNSAAFIKTDTATQGNWKPNYGADGWNVSQDTSANNPQIPAYAQVAFSGANGWAWAGSTSDVRALQKTAAGSADRIAGCWYGGASYDIDVNTTDGNTHQIALYGVDWDGYGPRSETIQVLDGDTAAVLDSRSLSAFQNGIYEVWNVKGHVKFHVVNNLGGYNIVLSGLFFGGAPVSTPDFGLSAPSGTVTLTRGQNATATLTETPLNGFTGSVNLVASGLPSGVTAAFSPNPATGASVLTLTASAAAATGPAAITITGTSGALTHTATLNVNVIAVSAASATLIRTDATTQGAWKGQYGTDGWNIAQDGGSNNPKTPAYAQVTFTNHNDWAWSGATADVRALQKTAATATDRIAACWYSGVGFDIDLNLTDGNLHEIALYALDWDGYGPRAETVQVLDSATGNVLDTENLTAFQNGKYLVWNIKGHVKLHIINPSTNVVISGLFFGGK